MKKMMLIGFGIVLLVSGISYSVFWNTVIRDFRALAVAEASPSPGSVDRQRMALKIIRVDLSAVAEASSGGSAEIAKMISRRVYIHLGIGVISAVIGLVVLIKGIVVPKQCSQQENA